MLKKLTVMLLILFFTPLSFADFTEKIYPQKINNPKSPLPTELVKQWREEGYCLIDGLYQDQEIQTLRAAIVKAMQHKQTADFGGLEFPAGPKDFLNLALDEKLLNISMQLLNSDRVELSQADAWVKTGNPRPSSGYKVFDNYDQRLHMDYPNHTMTHPPTWYKPEAVAMILYLDDHEQTGGMTGVYSRKDPNDPAYKYPYMAMPGVANWPWINDRTHAEKYMTKHNPEAAALRAQIYRDLKYAAFKPGTILLYRHDLWHRGTPLKDGQQRVVINLLYKKPGLRWFTDWAKGYAHYLYDWQNDPTGKAPQASEFAQLIPTLNTKQLAALGFPIPGDPEVDQELLLALSARYPGFNISRYVR